MKAAQITDAGDGEGAIKHSVSVSGSKRKADSGGVDVDVDGDVDGDGDSGKEKRKSQIQDRHQEIATSLLSACEEKLGLARLYRWLGGSGDETSSGTASSDEIKRIKTAFTQKMLKMVDPSNGRLDVRNLFSPLSAYGQEKRGAGWAGVEEDDAAAALPLPVRDRLSCHVSCHVMSCQRIDSLCSCLEDYYSLLLLAYLSSSGALGSPGPLPSYSDSTIIAQHHHLTPTHQLISTPKSLNQYRYSR